MVAQPSDSMAIELPSAAPSAPESVPESASESAPNVLHSIQAQIQSLPPERQREVLDFIEFLAQKNQTPEPKKTIWENIDDLMAEVPNEEWEQPPQQTIWEKIRERAARIPDEEWEGMPTDGSYQHDHYLYGMPKQEL
jgi:Protein of unknown function (DUF2281)